MRRLTIIICSVSMLALAALATGPQIADACAGLIGSNGAVNLARTTTLAGYHDGVEHYVTSFQFEGGGGAFGALIPLPGVPTNIERGGAWTLQRLLLETQPPEESVARLASAPPEFGDVAVLQQVRIDALDLTVLRGGGPSVATWAQEHGFHLSPDAPEVLDFYARRSPIFLAAVFDGAAAAARGQQFGDGTPVHLTIPTANPWVPLRILSLGKLPLDHVQADVFLLTDRQPALLPTHEPGMRLTHSAPATRQLLSDLRGDAGMGWVPQSAWLSQLSINTRAQDLHFDLAVDASGGNSPSLIDAGFALSSAGASDGFGRSLAWMLAGLAAAFAISAVALRWPGGQRRQA